MTHPAENERQAHSRVGELEHRIRAIESADDDAYGSFTGLDWLLCILGALVVPVIVLLWFAR